MGILADEPIVEGIGPEATKCLRELIEALDKEGTKIIAIVAGKVDETGDPSFGLMPGPGASALLISVALRALAERADVAMTAVDEFAKRSK